MAKGRARGNLAPRLIAVAVASCFASAPAWSNPTGAQVVNGTVGFARPNASTLRVTNSPGAIINWQGFSIGAGEITRFIQQSSSSAVLNRVVGADISSIQGQLLSNGRVFLINPSGIVVGPGAVIDTAGFVGSTLAMQDADFLAGRLKFAGDAQSGRIVNEGWIRTGQGGQVMLVAPQIKNSGLIHTPRGELVLAAGRRLTISSLDHEGVQFEIQAPTDSVINVGKLLAEGGAIGVFAGTLRHSGEVRATSLALDATGEIVLSAQKDIELTAGSITSASGVAGGRVQLQSGDTSLVSGSIEAKGSEGKGGTIHVLGDKVGLVGRASVDATGEKGGGTILVGGDFQGGNPAVPKASRNYVGADAVVRADAIASGDGGRVIVWADDATAFYGHVSARGGAERGDGGFAEVSGRNWLDFRGTARLDAPNGNVGTLLLDPSNIYIANSLANANAAGMSGTDTSADTSAATFLSQASGAVQDSLLLTGTLQGLLGANNVAVSTANAAGTGVGNINLIDPLNAAGTGNLTLVAHNNININAPVTRTGIGGARFFAGWNQASGTVNPTVVSGTGSININQSVTTKATELRLVAGKNISIANGVTIENAPASGESTVMMQAVGGSITANAGGANTTIRSQAADEGTTTNNATLSLTAGSGITLNNATVEARGFGSGHVSSITFNAGSIALNNTSLSAIAGNGSDSGGDASVALTATAGAISLGTTTITATAGDGLGGGSGIVGGEASVTLSGNSGITLNNSSSITATGGNGESMGGAATVSLTATAGTLALNSSTLSATGGGPALDAPVTGGAATLTLSADVVTVNSGSISAVGGAGSTTGGAALVALQAGAGNISIGSGSTITVTGGDAPDAGDATITLQATAGGISVNSGTIIANGGSGSDGSGGTATVQLQAQTSIAVTNASAVTANGGVGFDGGPATVSVTATAGGITINNSAITAAGGNASGAAGGAATVSMSAAAAGITVDNGNLAATGGDGSGGAGGQALVTITGVGITLNSTSMTATGGDAFSFGADATASVTAISGGNINLTDSNVTVNGGGATTMDGAAAIDIIAEAGAIMQSGGGALAVASPNGGASRAIDLQARDGIGIPGAPIRVADGFTTLNANNAQLFAGTTGDIVVAQTTGDVTLGTGAYTLINGAAGGSFDIKAESGSIIVPVGPGFSNPNGPITLRADSMDIQGAVTAAGGTGAISLHTATAGRSIELGTIGDPPGALALSGIELANLSGGLLTIGTSANPVSVTDAISFAQSLSLPGALTVSGLGSLDIAGATNSVGSIAGNGSIILSGGALVVGSDNTSTLFSGVISGASGLIKQGTATLTLSGANTYTGATTVNDGTLALNGGAAIANTGAVNLAASGAGLVLGANETIGSLTGVAGTTVALGGSTLRVGDSGSTTFAGVLSGTGGLTKQGTGTLTLSGANTYSGATTVNTGTLALGAAERIRNQSAVTVAGGATFNLAGFAETVGSIGGAGDVTLGAGTLAAGGNNTSSVYSGVISGTGGLVKEGTGTLTLSGANTYTGATAVSAGTLALGAAERIDNQSAVTVAGGATFNLAGFGETVGSIGGAGNVALGAGTLTAGGDNTSSMFSGVMSGTGGLVKQGTGTLTLSGANTYGGSTTVNAGTLAILGGAAIADGSAMVMSGGILSLIADEAVGSLAGTSNVALGANTLAVGGNNASTLYSGVIGGTGGLTKQGTGTLILSGANTYTGATAVSAGTLALGAAERIDNQSAVTVAGGATFNLAGFGETVGSIGGAGNVALGAGTLTAGGDNTSSMFSGVMSGTGGLIKRGTGTLTLSGTNTYSGATMVKAGTLALSDAELSGVIINESATTVSGMSLVSGGVQSSGALDLKSGASLTVSGTGFDWQGGTLVGGGNLTVQGGAPFRVTGSTVHTLNGPAITLANLDITGGSLNLQAGTVNVSDTITVGSGTTLASQGATINAPTATLDLSGTFQSGAGSVTVGNMKILAGGVLKGTGTLNADVNNLAGTVSPGLSPGILTIDGDYAQGAAGTLSMDIGGTVPGASGHDQLVVTGMATLGGTLNASLVNGFVPAAGNSFTLIKAGSVSGTFDTTNLPAGAFFTPAYLVSSFVLNSPPAVITGPPLSPIVVVEDERQRKTLEEAPEKPIREGPTAPICR